MVSSPPGENLPVALSALTARGPHARLFFPCLNPFTMIPMLHRLLIRFAASVAVLSLSSALPAAAQSSGRGRNYKAPPLSAHIQVTVLRDSDGKPLENVSVIFHPIEGDRDKGGMEVKTNEDGKALIDVIPIGDTIRMQIFASGYQTYGEDYKVDQDQISKEVRMKRPGAQYSTYKSNPGGNKESGSTAGQSPASGQNSEPNANASGGEQGSSGTGSPAKPSSK